MGAVAEQLGDVVSIAVEVDAAVCRRCTEASPSPQTVRLTPLAVRTRRAYALAATSYLGSSGSNSVGCRRKAAKNASTTSGANCVPRQRCTSAAASSTDIDVR